MLLDIILLALIIICAYLGYKRGFVRSLCGVCSLALSVIVAFLSYSKITEFVAASPVGRFINGWLSDTMGSSAVDLSAIPEPLRKPFEAGAAAAADSMASSLGTVVISIISVIITVILVRLLIKLVFHLLDIFAKLPVLKQFNRLLGGLFGVVSGCFWVCIIVFALTYISLIPSLEFLHSLVESSDVVALLAEHNFLLAFLPDSK